ncbi:hypothetical protein MMC28_003189 [Mycoblastus sanguinarius]|nr:hypothetical protein [Mycoblastus sanguinarius]
MHVLIIGASGRTGLLVVDEALKRGHTVTALVRDPTSLPPKDGLTVVKGTPLNKADIETAFTITATPPAAVIIALNARRTSESPFAAPASPPRLMADSAANVIAAMNAHGVRKIVIMQALGVGDSLPNLFFAMRWLIKYSAMAAQFADHNLVDEEVKAASEGVDYVLARPTRLEEGDRMPVKFFGDQGMGIGSFASITRKSVAAFLIDAAEKGDWDKETPVIAN